MGWGVGEFMLDPLRLDDLMSVVLGTDPAFSLAEAACTVWVEVGMEEGGAVTGYAELPGKFTTFN